MSKKKRFGVSEALSRGLSETIHVVENNSGVFRNVILPLSRIELDPDNPRKLAITLQDIRQGLNKYDGDYPKKLEELEKLKELAITIETSGVINPIIVYKRGEVYRVVAGERRCLASILAGKNEIEARIFNDKPKGFELKLIQWIENTAREDLTLEERIGNIREIIQEYQNQHGEIPVTATLIKNITGLSLPQATCYIAVLNAPPDVKLVIENGRIRNLDKAALIATIQPQDIRQEMISACLNGANLKELRKMIQKGKPHLNTIPPNQLNNKRGRALTRINMGFTVSPKVIQTLIQSVLNQTNYHHYSDRFAHTDWSHFEHATRAFKQLIEILEQEVTR